MVTGKKLNTTRGMRQPESHSLTQVGLGKFSQVPGNLEGCTWAGDTKKGPNYPLIPGWTWGLCGHKRDVRGPAAAAAAKSLQSCLTLYDLVGCKSWDRCEMSEFWICSRTHSQINRKGGRVFLAQGVWAQFLNSHWLTTELYCHSGGPLGNQAEIYKWESFTHRA